MFCFWCPFWLRTCLVALWLQGPGGLCPSGPVIFRHLPESPFPWLSVIFRGTDKKESLTLTLSPQPQPLYLVEMTACITGLMPDAGAQTAGGRLRAQERRSWPKGWGEGRRGTERTPHPPAVGGPLTRFHFCTPTLPLPPPHTQPHPNLPHEPTPTSSLPVQHEHPFQLVQAH